MKVDLDKRLVFQDVVHTNMRPDMVLSSEHPHMMSIVELTVPWEEMTY